MERLFCGGDGKYCVIFSFMIITQNKITCIKTDFFPFQICSNWQRFYDPQSGIAMYMVGVGSSPNKTDVANLTRFSSQSHVACVKLKPDRYLTHNQKYFSTVYAYNGGHKQQNVSAISNGGKNWGTKIKHMPVTYEG